VTKTELAKIRRLTGYALCRRLREAAEGMSCEQNQVLMRRAADIIDETYIETATQYNRKVRR
jgi:hypothetical protein